MSVGNVFFQVPLIAELKATKGALHLLGWLLRLLCRMVCFSLLLQYRFSVPVVVSLCRDSNSVWVSYAVSCCSVHCPFSTSCERKKSSHYERLAAATSISACIAASDGITSRTHLIQRHSTVWQRDTLIYFKIMAMQPTHSVMELSRKAEFSCTNPIYFLECVFLFRLPEWVWQGCIEAARYWHERPIHWFARV